MIFLFVQNMVKQGVHTMHAKHHMCQGFYLWYELCMYDTTARLTREAKYGH